MKVKFVKLNYAQFSVLERSISDFVESVLVVSDGKGDSINSFFFDPGKVVLFEMS